MQQIKVGHLNKIKQQLKKTNYGKHKNNNTERNKETLNFSKKILIIRKVQKGAEAVGLSALFLTIGRYLWKRYTFFEDEEDCHGITVTKYN